MLSKTKTLKWIKALLSTVGFIYIAYLIYKHQNSFESFFNQDVQLNLKYKFLVFGVILMPFNWLLESIKWQLLLKPIERIPLIASLNGILSGVAVSLFTPNRIGEFAGRIMLLSKRNRISGTIASFIGSIAQLFCTLMLGLWAISYLFYDKAKQHFNELNSINLIIIITFIVLCLFIASKFLLLPLIKKHKQTLLKSIAFTKKYSTTDVLVLFFLSIGRYCIFTLQFIFFLFLFNNSISFIQALGGVCTSFLIGAFIPSVALAELGVRGSVAAFVFSSFTQNIIPIISASTALWLVNLALPALVGTLVWNKFKT